MVGTHTTRAAYAMTGCVAHTRSVVVVIEVSSKSIISIL
jgi:hypothetical protein